MNREFIGQWGDKYSMDIINIKIQKKDGKVFYISPGDIKKFLELQDLLEEQKRIGKIINKYYPPNPYAKTQT
jgi:hypothetical protein